MKSNIVFTSRSSSALFSSLSFLFANLVLQNSHALAVLFHIQRRWIYFGFTLLLFLYLYLKPLLQSANQSASSFYILWLFSSAACHIPGLARIGIDLRASTTRGLGIFAVTAACLLVLLALRSLLQKSRVLPPGLPNLPPWSHGNELAWKVCSLAFTISLSGTTYGSICSAESADGSATAAARRLLCEALPSRIRIRPLFSALAPWASESTPVPLFWLTLVALCVATHVADILSLDVVLLTSNLHKLSCQGVSFDPRRAAELNLAVATVARQQKAEWEPGARGKATAVDSGTNGAGASGGGPSTSRLSGESTGPPAGSPSGRSRRLSFTLDERPTTAAFAELRPITSYLSGAVGGGASLAAAADKRRRQLRAQEGPGGSRAGRSGLGPGARLGPGMHASGAQGNSPMSHGQAAYGYGRGLGMGPGSDVDSPSRSPRGWRGSSWEVGGASGSPSPRSLRSAPSHVDPSLPSSPSMKGLKPAADEWSGRDEDKGLLGWASGVLGSILYSAAQGSGSGREEPGPKPDFLPPVPWFTGTSADIAKTAIHLSIAVNLFLGRFDIRVMQALQGSYLKRNGPAAGLGHGAGAGASAASLPNGSVASSAPEDDLPEGAEGHRSATHDKMYQGRPPVGPHVSRSVPQPESLGGPAPHHGDGYTYEHLARRTCITMDFMADTGDGGDATYAVARCLASPELVVSDPESLVPSGSDTALPGGGGALSPVVSFFQALRGRGRERGAAQKGKGPTGGPGRSGTGPGSAPGGRVANSQATRHVLPRADVLVLGGDLCYPMPTPFNFERRLFQPFEYALPPPPHYSKENIAWRKPDLEEPPSGAAAPPGPAGLYGGSNGAGNGGSPLDSDPLAGFTGPQCFAIPGNHDHIDGGICFERHILLRGWLGGWLLPQQKAYFSLALPHGWWILGLDLGLSQDLDTLQYTYFYRLVTERLGPDDNAIIITHEPIWLTSWWDSGAESDTQSASSSIPPAQNLRQLINLLNGRCRIHLAGDLHFYMRHSMVPPEKETAGPEDLKGPMGAGTYGWGQFEGSAWRAGDPEHLIVSGSGGAFTHPTHGFAYSRFLGRVLRGGGGGRGQGVQNAGRQGAPAAGRGVYQDSGSSTPLRGASPGPDQDGPSVVRQPGSLSVFIPKLRLDPPAVPSGAESMYNTATRSAAAAARGASPPPLERERSMGRAGGGLGGPEGGRERSEMGRGANSKPVEGSAEYRCFASYPSPAESLKISSPFVFRTINNTFDRIGGSLYCLIISSVIPRCSVGRILDEPSFPLAAAAFAREVMATIGDVLLEGRVSLVAVIGVIFGLVTLARAGGAGTSRLFWDAGAKGRLNFGPGRPRRRHSSALVIGVLHALAHFLTAAAIAVLLELGSEILVRYGVEGVGADRWSSAAAAAQHVPVVPIAGLGGFAAEAQTFISKAMSGIWRALLLFYDLPELLSAGRAKICAAPGGVVARADAASFYFPFFMGFWIFSTPCVAAILGLYLYLCVTVLPLHFDEAFSAMQHKHNKGFLRIQVTEEGTLRIYSLGLPQTPENWKEDSKFWGPLGGGNGLDRSWDCQFPSRWVPSRKGKMLDNALRYSFLHPLLQRALRIGQNHVQVVDYIEVPATRQDARRGV